MTAILLMWASIPLGLGVCRQQLLLAYQTRADRAEVLDEHAAEVGDLLGPSPGTLKFGPEDEPRDGHGTSLDHPPHGHLVRFQAHAARGVGDDVDLVVLAQRL